MKNISGQYQDLLEGKMSQAQFLRNARMMFPNFVTNHNSFDDSVKILKTKGMLSEGDAVKGTPDKEPTYDSLTPDDKIKYKKVEQSPEVDEQDGIYPATTITDIPKTKTYKKVKNTSDGLEPIKDNDTKNELKKVKVVKENMEPEEIENAEVEITTNDASIQAMADKMGISQEELFKLLLKRLGGLDEAQRSFDDVFGDFIETDDATEIKSFIKTKGKEAIAKIKAKLPQLKDAARTKLAKLMKVELDEARFKKGTDIGKPGPGFEKIAKAAGKEYGSKEAGKRVAGAILNKVLNKESALESLVTKVMNETLSKKSAK
jgi:hypothetical protein